MAKAEAKKNTVAVADTIGSKEADTKYTKHTKEDPALAPPEPDAEVEKQKGMSFFGRMVIFLVFPTMVGICGLYLGYLASRNDPGREMSFDVDFALPFTLALSMAVVIGFQTRGYTDKPTPLVLWPKVRKRQKITHKHVVIGENGEEIEIKGDDEPEEEAEEKPAEKKKDD
jgi:hypothetical protein